MCGKPLLRAVADAAVECAVFAQNQVNAPIFRRKDFSLKLLVWLSQHTIHFEKISSDVKSRSFSGNVVRAIKYITGKEFSFSDYMFIHELIGCGLNKELAKKFKEQDFDMEVLRRHREENSK